MEDSTGHSRKMDSSDSNISESEETPLQVFEMESPDTSDSSIRRSFFPDQQFHSMDALEILRESVRILRFNSSAFMVILALLICPVSAVALSNFLVEEPMVKKLSIKFLLVAQSSGIPLKPYIKQLCHRLSEMALSTAFSFPVYITLSLLAKAATIYSVDCTYLRKKFDTGKFFAVVVKIWKRLVWTYLWVCMVIFGCIALFLVLVIAICNVFSFLGFQSYLVTYPLVLVGLVFAVIFANAIIISNLSIVISVLEDVSGMRALLRSGVLIQGQIQVGLLIFFGSTIGMAFIEGLYDHRVKTVSYGDGSSRLWEGPLLVFMYSFVVLIDYMMSAVFYFTCRASSMEASSSVEEEDETLVAAMVLST